MDQQLPRRTRPLKNQYLLAYNLLSATLWLIILGRLLLLLPLVGPQHIHGGLGNFTRWTQTLAILELFHAASGLVRASISTTTIQIASRLLLVWGIVRQFPNVANSLAYTTMILAWSITEVVRYSYFVAYLRNGGADVPAILTWLRYNTFYVLYPLGIISEESLIYQALGPPKKVRIEWEWVLKAILLLYLPGSYIMYTHMMTQRRRIIRGKQVQRRVD